jgi:hypothetical protein
LKAEIAQKILSPVPYEKGFHFFMPDGHPTGQTAISLYAFLKDLDRTDIESIRFHFDRRDFQKWIGTTLGDEELAKKIDEIPNQAEEQLKNALREIVQKRISQLQLIDT